MKQLLFVAILLMFLGGTTAYATEKTCENSNFWNAVANECSPHTVDTDTHAGDRENPLGVGADVLLHETEKADFVAEYKYDFENEEHSAFLVVRTKQSLWSIIKGFLGR